MFKFFTGNAAVIAQQLQPQVGFIRFLKQAIEFGTEFRVGSSTRCFLAREIIAASRFNIALAIGGFQIFLSMERILFIQACFVVNQFKWPPIRCGWNSACIMQSKPRAQITSASGIELPIRSRTKHVNVYHPISRAKRAWAATEVPERRNCPPKMRTSSRPLGSFT